VFCTRGVGGNSVVLHVDLRGSGATGIFFGRRRDVIIEA